MNSKPILRVDSLSTGYGQVQVLHDFKFTVYEGEIISILGANGAGKSTLLSSLIGVKNIWSGAIEFQGKDVTLLSTAERVKLGMVLVPEGRKIFPKLTVYENLKVGAYLNTEKVVFNNNLQRIYELFPILSQRTKQYGGTLSGGEQQMLAIGRALMSSPKLLFLDEPSMGIAPLLTLKIYESINKLSSEGMTIVLVEQNAKLALKMCLRAVVMELGKVVIEDTADRLLADPRVQEIYLGGA